MEHSPTSATGTGVAANYVAAWEALKKMRPTNYTLGWMLRLALCSLMLAACGAVAQGPLPIDQGPESFDRSPQDDNGLYLCGDCRGWPGDDEPTALRPPVDAIAGGRSCLMCPLGSPPKSRCTSTCRR